MTFQPPSPQTALDDLVDRHPRLSLTDTRLAALQQRLAGGEDPAATKIADDVRALGEQMLGGEDLSRDLINGRLLKTAHQCVDRMYTLGLLWRLDGEDRWAQAAWKTLDQVCLFDDWNPGHELDFCEMAHGVAIGLDWLWAWLGDDRRDRLVENLIEKALVPALEKYHSDNGPKWAGRVLGRFNWNQVCSGGLIVAALAVGQRDPQRAGEVLARSVAAIPLALATYAPDGMWGEGSDYWHYGTMYTCYALSAMQTALGHDFGLGQMPGLDRTARWPVLTQGPTGRLPNFGDNGRLPNYTDNAEFAIRRPMPEMFYLARRFGDDLVARDEHRILADHPAGPEHLVWYLPDPGSQDRPRDVRFAGDVELACFRSAWDDPDAMCLTIKGGYNLVNHGQLDLGVFELDALGVRWAIDLGKEHYGVPGYWDRHTDSGRRWTYFRAGSAGHNVVTLDQDNQRVTARSRFVRYASTDASAGVVLELSEALAPRAWRARRGARLLAGRRMALVQDELTLTRPVRVDWQMLTPAEVEISQDGRSALLKSDGRELLLEAGGDEQARFEVESVQTQPDPESDNPGISRLRLSLQAGPGPVRLAVRFRPAEVQAEPVEVIPLEDWPGVELPSPEGRPS
jgi:hypothetical protein